MRSVGPVLGLLSTLGIAGAATAQGPSFDCAFATSLTEQTICASPELSAVEEDMAEAYAGLADRIGEGDARRIADMMLARRDACGADEACIRDRLLSSMGLFLSGGRDLAANAALSDVAVGLGEVPATGAVPPAVDVSPLDAGPTPSLPATAAPAVTVPAIVAPPAVVPDTPLGRAFQALAPYERANIQGRLFEAGFLPGGVTGTWDAATEAALADFLVEAEREGATLSADNEAEAHTMLEVIDSDGYERRFLGETVPDTVDW